MTAYLTSFKQYHADRAFADDHGLGALPGYSIAVYQPHWLPQLPKLDLFDIRVNGSWIRPRDFIRNSRVHDATVPDEHLLRQYHDTLLSVYRERWAAISNPDQEPRFIRRPWEDQNVALCCWCPYDKAAKRQIETYGSFVCHSWPVETFLREHGVDVVRDLDRNRMVR